MNEKVPNCGVVGGRRPPGGRGARVGFTLIELLVVISIISLLVGIVLPCLNNARKVTQRTVCAANLRATQTGLELYLEDSGGNFFPYRKKKPGGILWYWGFEDTTVGAPEGMRPIDPTQARLARYVSRAARTTSCPAFSRDYPGLKPKFDLPGYGFAINRQMLAGGEPELRRGDITRPGSTVAWADSAQINTWQLPATPQNPMLEEWYYLDNRRGTPPTFHFRHSAGANAVFADNHVEVIDWVWVDPRCDGLVGRPEEPVEPSEVAPLLKLRK
ncbi:MAG: type II secretion system protein [Planctomycetota bacterium]|jgi:prepilin-type N-terminal cleavage/methylation domain-containing protein/prepilin-type processing-associated H-X9-DG protein